MGTLELTFFKLYLFYFIFLGKINIAEPDDSGMKNE